MKHFSECVRRKGEYRQFLILSRSLIFLLLSSLFVLVHNYLILLLNKLLTAGSATQSDRLVFADDFQHQLALDEKRIGKALCFGSSAQSTGLPRLRPDADEWKGDVLVDDS